MKKYFSYGKDPDKAANPKIKKKLYAYHKTGSKVPVLVRYKALTKLTIAIQKMNTSITNTKGLTDLGVRLI